MNQMPNGCRGRDSQEGGQPVTDRERYERGKRTMEEGRGTDKRDGVNRKAGRNEEELESALEHERSRSI